MKKSILLAMAAGALAIGSAASAQVYGWPGQPAYSTPATPAVVAGTGYAPPSQYGNHNAYPDTYGNNSYPGTYGNQVYVDPYGRQVTYDQYGRQVYVQPNTGSYGIVGYDQWGRPLYGTTTTTTTYGTVHGSLGSPGDRDGDGVANVNDRWPDDRRYR